MEYEASFSDGFELSEDEIMTPLINFNMKEDEPKQPPKPNEKSNLVTRNKLNALEEISSPLEVTDIIGKTGLWQIKILVLTALTSLPTAWNHLGIAFLAYPVDHWCSRPNSNINLETWWTQFLPNTTLKGESHHSQCEMYYVNRTAGIPNKNRIISCDSYEYSPDYNTIVNKWNLVCSEEWLISTSQTIYMCGFLVSVLLSGHLADKYGRHPTVMLNLVTLIVAGFAAAFSSTFILFTICRFFVGLGHGGLGLVAYIIVIETVGSEYRARYMFLHGVGWHTGYMLFPLIAWLQPDWFYLQIIITAPSIAYLSFYWILPESPRWLLVHGHIDKALPILEDAIRTNGLEVKNLENQARILVNIHFKGKEKSSITFLDLLSTPNLRMKTLCLYFIWAAIAFTYYGLSLNTNSLIGNDYVNFFLSGFMEIPATIVCLLTIDRFGRKKPFFIALLFGGLACFACIFVPERYAKINTGFAMVGKMFNSASFGIVYLFSSEIFPTVARNVGVGSSSTVARIGSSVAPFMRDLGNATNPAVPLALFGVLSTISALLVLKMPETNNQPVPESIDDAENFGKSEISPVPPIQLRVSDDSS